MRLVVSYPRRNRFAPSLLYYYKTFFSLLQVGRQDSL